jgi:hypothetical protein
MMGLESDTRISEKNEYLTQQLITCIGNKRALLGFIDAEIKKSAKKAERG